MGIIEINDLTKSYGQNKGVFQLSLSIGQGEVFGYLGPNGAGKTTTIRHLMGFLKPQQGSCRIKGLDCWKKASEIQVSLGYLPGEISFFDDMTGLQFLNFIASLRKLKDLSYMEALIKAFELDGRGKIKKMSKGMKQKLGLICAFMHDPEVLILDEPTSGLDPLMQNRFIELILNEKMRGKTILMSSHSFEEVERTCDRVGIIKQGRLMAVDSVENLKESQRRIYSVTLSSPQEAQAFALEDNITATGIHGNKVRVDVRGNIQPFLNALVKYHVTDLGMAPLGLEEIFLHFYGGEEK